MKLDPNPVPGPNPIARRENQEAARRENPEARSPPQIESKPSTKDYFSTKSTALRNRNIEQEPLQKFSSAESTNGSRNSSQPSSPHIAHQYQDRGRQLSNDLTTELNRKKTQHAPHNSINAVTKDIMRDAPVIEPRPRRNGESQQNGRFMLQEAPKSKKTEKRNSKSDGQSPLVDRSASISKQRTATASSNTQVKEQQIFIPTNESPDSSKSEATLSESPRDFHPSRSHTSTDSYSSPPSTQIKNLPERGDSLAKSGQHPPPKRGGESGATSKLANSLVASSDSYDKSASAPPSTTLPSTNHSSNKGAPKSLDSPSNGHIAELPPHPPLRAKERLALHQEDSSSDSFVTPRAPPQPPSSRNKNEASNLRNGEYPGSPKLPRYSDRDDMFVEDETARTPIHDGQHEQGGFLRRVSHSVRHARSYSDRPIRLSKEQKWSVPKSPMIGSPSPSFPHEISSPIASSPESRKDELDRIKKELELERHKNLELEAALDAKNSIRQMNTELKEKRSTMVVLDTQKEIVVRELDILTEHITAAKRSGEPLDVSRMTNTVLREFAHSLQALKDSFQPQIEELTQRRNNLTDEVNKLDQRKDKSAQEFEQITVKNSQLAELNNQLVHQIQELYKANAGPAVDVVRPSPNGLGIYNTQIHKDRSAASVDNRDNRPSFAESNMTGSTMIPDQEAEPATYLASPQVVNIRKAQPKKFNWKKGGQHVAKGVTKGLKGAFSSDGNRGQREGQYGTEGMPYGAMSQQEHPRTDSYSKGSGQERGPGFGGFFGNPKTRPQQWKNSPNNSFPAVNSDGPPCKLATLLELWLSLTLPKHSSIPSSSSAQSMNVRIFPV